MGGNIVSAGVSTWVDTHACVCMCTFGYLGEFMGEYMRGCMCRCMYEPLQRRMVDLGFSYLGKLNGSIQGLSISYA